MATIQDYFYNDKEQNIKVFMSQEITDSCDGLKIPVRMFLDFSSGAIYLAYSLSKVDEPLKRCMELFNDRAINGILEACRVFSVQGPKDIAVHASELKFCGQIYIYSESVLNDDEQGVLLEEGKKYGLTVHYFGPDWAQKRSAMEKPLAFISHDSRDKDLIARPLVLELSKIPGCTVWFDEFSLNVGDSLRESIEQGIKECKKCILILTPNFLRNSGWTKEEFNSVFTRQIIEQENIILPVWAGVTRKDVYNYSPSLADKVAVNWNIGIEKVANELHKSVTAV